ncbi:MAG: hypothetical protein AMXMBFR13_04830 [Phycisphaerae bacterium]
MSSLLAVDLGLRTGLALFGQDGRLIWYRSQNFGTTPRLRRGVHAILRDLPELEWLVLEGGGPIADVWEREAARSLVGIRRISAEEWRGRLLLQLQQRTGPQAKHSADELARRVIDWSSAARPTSLRHDAAEAILLGLWAVLEVGWLAALPAELR